MNKKLSNGEKYWKQLMFRYRQLKKLGVLRNEDGQQMSFKEFRGSQFNKTITKEVTLTSKKGKKFTRKIVKFVPLKEFRKVVEKKPKHKQALPRDERRKLRKLLHLHIVIQTQKLKAVRKAKKKQRAKEDANE